MNQSHPLKKASPRDRAWSAMDLLGWAITWNEEDDQAEDDETVRMGLDAMASALVEWRALDLANATPLDEVLAELGVDDDLVETTARLAELLGRASYAGGLNEDGVEQAEGLREQLVEALDGLLNQLDDKDLEGSDD